MYIWTQGQEGPPGEFIPGEGVVRPPFSPHARASGGTTRCPQQRCPLQRGRRRRRRRGKGPAVAAAGVAAETAERREANAAGEAAPQHGRTTAGGARSAFGRVASSLSTAAVNERRGRHASSTRRGARGVLRVGRERGVGAGRQTGTMGAEAHCKQKGACRQTQPAHGPRRGQLRDGRAGTSSSGEGEGYGEEGGEMSPLPPLPVIPSLDCPDRGGDAPQCAFCSGCLAAPPNHPGCSFFFSCSCRWYSDLMAFNLAF